MDFAGQSLGDRIRLPLFLQVNLETAVLRDIGEMHGSIRVDIAIDVGMRNSGRNRRNKEEDEPGFHVC